MIRVKFKNGVCLIKGTIDLGYLGVYKNLNGSKEISLEASYEEIIDDMNNSEFSSGGYEFTWNFLNDHVTDDSETSVAAAIQQFFNDQEEEVSDKIDYVNGQFLEFLYDDLQSTYYPFWEIEELVNWELMDGISKDDIEGKTEEIEEFVYSNALNFDDLEDDYSNMEELFKEALPTFNLTTFLEKIIPESLTLTGMHMAFQCSDDYDCEILCAAYAEIKENLEFSDWHNQ